MPGTVSGVGCARNRQRVPPLPQAVFYLVIFRHRELAAAPSGKLASLSWWPTLHQDLTCSLPLPTAGIDFLKKLHLDRVISTRLNPLKVCLIFCAALVQCPLSPPSTGPPSTGPPSTAAALPANCGGEVCSHYQVRPAHSVDHTPGMAVWSKWVGPVPGPPILHPVSFPQHCQ